MWRSLWLGVLLSVAVRCYAFTAGSAASARSVARAQSVTALRAISPDGTGKDMAAFRKTLTKQMEREANDVFDGYALSDLIVDKWGMPYDIQIKTLVFAGKPLIHLNVMWRYLGQQSFPLTEQQYLEHLEAIAQLVIKWDRVDHVKELIRTCRKRPQAYFGYAVSLPLDLPPDTLMPIFPDNYDN